MIVLDTHAFIWHTSEPRRLSRKAAEAIAATDSLAISAVTCWEVAMLVSRGRIALDRDLAVWLRQAVADITVEPVTCDVARQAGQLEAPEFPGDPADQLIWATARRARACLVTADRALRTYAPTETIW